MYWIVFALFITAEMITDVFLGFWYVDWISINILLLFHWSPSITISRLFDYLTLSLSLSLSLSLCAIGSRFITN